MCATDIYACGKAAWNEASSSLQPCAERRSQGRQGAGHKAAPHVFVSNTIYLNLWLPPKNKSFLVLFFKKELLPYRLLMPGASRPKTTISSHSVTSGFILVSYYVGAGSAGLQTKSQEAVLF
jgi:hypothetical protein